MRVDQPDVSSLLQRVGEACRADRCLHVTSAHRVPDAAGSIAFVVELEQGEPRLADEDPVGVVRKLLDFQERLDENASRPDGAPVNARVPSPAP